MAAIYPLLALAEGFDSEQFANRPLLENNDHVLPLVTFARFDDAGQVKCVKWESLKKRGHTIQDIEGRSTKGLVERAGRPGWEPMNIMHEGQEVTILMRQGDVVTASDILDGEMMDIAANYFSAEQVFVGIPCQTTMIASNQGEYIYQTLLEYYNGAEAKGLIPLSPHIYCLQGGNILGIAEVEEHPPPAAAAAAPAGAGDIPRAVPQIFSYEGKNAFWVTLPCNSYEGLYHAIQTEMAEYGPRLPNWEGFQGSVVFHIEPGSVRLTMEERKAFEQLAGTLTHQITQAGWQSPYGDPISVRILLPPPGQDTGKVDKGDAKAEGPAADAGKKKRKTRAKGTKTKGKTRSLRTGTRISVGKGRPTEAGSESDTRNKRRTRSTTSHMTTGLDLVFDGDGPVTIQQIKQQIPNKLGMAIWGFRLFYILICLTLLGLGIAAMAGVAAVGKVHNEGVSPEGGMTAVENPGGAIAAPAPAPAPKSGPPVPVTAPRSGPPQPVTGNTGQDASSNKVNVAGASALVGLFFFVPAILMFVMYEFVLILGLKKLKGWARILGILASMSMVLTLVGLPFGAMALLGLVNNGTVQMFNEAKNLRRLRRLR